MTQSLISNITAETNMAAVSTRNVAIGGIAVFNSLVVFLLVAATTHMKKPIKLTLLNLLASDIALMLTGLVYGLFVQTKLTSGHSLCVVTVFGMINGFFLSHAAVAGISLHNFVAIFYPFKHNVHVTAKAVSVAIVITWLSLCLISGSCIIVHFPLHEPCVVLSNIPRYGAVIVFCVLFLVDFSVIVMNVSLFVAIRKRKQVHVNTVFSVSRGRWAQTRVTNPHAPSSPFPPTPPSPVHQNHPADDGNNQRNPTDLDEPNAPNEIPPVKKSRHIQNTPLPGIMSRRKNTSRIHLPQMGGKKKCSLKVSYHGNTINLQLEPQTTSNSRDTSSTMSVDKPTSISSTTDESSKPGDISSKRSSNCSTVPLVEHISKFKTAHKDEKRSPLVKSQNRMSMTSVSQGKKNTKRNQFRKLSVSMVIISIWCCMFNVPCSLYLFYVAFLAEDRFQANYNTMGVVFTTLLTVNVLGDPFIYAWRFVQWKHLAKRLKRFCCERQHF